MGVTKIEKNTLTQMPSLLIETMRDRNPSKKVKKVTQKKRKGWRRKPLFKEDSVPKVWLNDLPRLHIPFVNWSPLLDHLFVQSSLPELDSSSHRFPVQLVKISVEWNGVTMILRPHFSVLVLDFLRRSQVSSCAPPRSDKNEERVVWVGTLKGEEAQVTSSTHELQLCEFSHLLPCPLKLIHPAEMGKAPLIWISRAPPLRDWHEVLESPCLSICTFRTELPVHPLSPCACAVFDHWLGHLLRDLCNLRNWMIISQVQFAPSWTDHPWDGLSSSQLENSLPLLFRLKITPAVVSAVGLPWRWCLSLRPSRLKWNFTCPFPIDHELDQLLRHLMSVLPATPPERDHFHSILDQARPSSPLKLEVSFSIDLHFESNLYFSGEWVAAISPAFASLIRYLHFSRQIEFVSHLRFNLLFKSAS